MWQTHKLGEICVFENGDRGKNYPSKKHQCEKGIPFINAGDLSKDGNILDHGMAYITEERYDLLGAGKIEIGDVLFCLRGSLGKCALNTSFKKGAIASSLVILRPKRKFLLPEFLLLYLKSPLIEKLIKNTASGTAQPNLSAKVVSEYELKIPSVEEQQRIVAKLDAAFAEIEKIRKKNEEKYANLIAMRNIYIDKLFSLLVGEKTILEKVTTTLTCGVAKRPVYVDNGIPFLSARNVKNGKMKWKNYKYIDKETHLKLTKYNKPEYGDILYSRVGSVGDAAIVDKHMDFSIFVSLTLIKPNKELLNEYLCYYLNSSFIKKLASASITGTGVGNLNVSAVRKFPIIIIPLAQQIALVKKINIFLEFWNKLVLKNSKESEDLIRLKEVILSSELDPRKK